MRTIDIGYTKAIALRVNYVGELGWELHVPAEHVLSVYDLIWAAGEPLGIADYGLYAMDSLRLEKCYRAWKGDLTTEYTPFMASLDRFVKLDKPGGFIGQAALRREAEAGPDRAVRAVARRGDRCRRCGRVDRLRRRRAGGSRNVGRLRLSAAAEHCARVRPYGPGGSRHRARSEILGERRRAVVGASRSTTRRTCGCAGELEKPKTGDDGFQASPRVSLKTAMWLSRSISTYNRDVSARGITLIRAGVRLRQRAVGYCAARGLPRQQLDGDAKDIVKLGLGLVSTLAALVLGLLVSSASTSFNATSNELEATAIKIVQLDRTLSQ